MRPLVLVLAMLLLAVPCLAQSGLTRVEGNIESLEPNTGMFSLRALDGSQQRVWVQNSTDITRDGNRVAIWQLRQGDRVTVEGVPMNDGRVVAASVRVSGGGGSGGGAGTVSATTPSPGSLISSTRPTVSATFNEPVTRVRLWVDNAEFTGEAAVSGNTLSWTPQYNLDNGEHTVRVEGYGFFGVPYKANWSFRIESGGAPGQVVNYAPGPGSYLTVRQPTISAEFSTPVDRRTIRFYVDGRDFTPQAQVSGQRVSWTPGYSLDYGEHTVRLEARTHRGQQVEGSWNFVITR